MAKLRRGGLGKGLNTLLRDGQDAYTTSDRTQKRDRIVYDEREDITYETSTLTDQGSRYDNKPVNLDAPTDTKSSNVSRETFDGKTPQMKLEKESEREDIKEPVADKVTKVEKATEVDNERKVDQASNNIKKTSNTVIEVDLEDVIPNPDQPRTSFKEEDLNELASSIKREGLIQPILVREAEDGKYQIIAGERRWQASKLAGKTTIPIQVKNVGDEKAIELALIENIQRTDLNPIEEAYGYKRLMERNRMTQADIAQAVSKGRSTIANSLRLLELPEDAQQALFEDKITAGHARAILSVPSKDDRSVLTQKIIDKKLSVRETESLARLMSNKDEAKVKREPVPAVYKSVARSLRDSLDTNVKVKSSKGKNRIEIEFTDERDLERIFDLISPE